MKALFTSKICVKQVQSILFCNICQKFYNWTTIDWVKSKSCNKQLKAKPKLEGLVCLYCALFKICCSNKINILVSALYYGGLFLLCCVANDGRTTKKTKVYEEILSNPKENIHQVDGSDIDDNYDMFLIIHLCNTFCMSREWGHKNATVFLKLFFDYYCNCCEKFSWNCSWTVLICNRIFLLITRMFYETIFCFFQRLYVIYSYIPSFSNLKLMCYGTEHFRCKTSRALKVYSSLCSSNKNVPFSRAVKSVFHFDNFTAFLDSATIKISVV